MKAICPETREVYIEIGNWLFCLTCDAFFSVKLISQGKLCIYLENILSKRYFELFVIGF